MGRWLAGFIAVVAVSPLPSRDTDATRRTAPVLIVQVVEDAGSQPLPNAEVIDLGSGMRPFTNLDGETRIPWPDRGGLRLRVRQLGFQFIDRDVARERNDLRPASTHCLR